MLRIDQHEVGAFVVDDARPRKRLERVDGHISAWLLVL